MLKKLIDPCAAPDRAGPRDERDLMIRARNGWVLAFDNLSKLPDWLSDALCRLSTGGGFSTRALVLAGGAINLSASGQGGTGGSPQLGNTGGTGGNGIGGSVSVLGESGNGVVDLGATDPGTHQLPLRFEAASPSETRLVVEAVLPVTRLAVSGM